VHASLLFDVNLLESFDQAHFLGEQSPHYQHGVLGEDALWQFKECLELAHGIFSFSPSGQYAFTNFHSSSQTAQIQTTLPAYR
jgi:hypothetical protein